ncbi:MAG: DUF1080 domain-containing protein [Verrucomicrobiae bacterium]|nr:DUF1080 domain-containing protein [Verrucomicrobiae bacterium]
MKPRNLLIGLAVAGIAATAAYCQEKANLTWTDPAKAKAEDPDFSIQGEYGADTAGQAWGAQVVALGDGKFDAYLLEGGLPGLGWTKEKARTALSGTANDLKSADGTLAASIAAGKIAVKKDGQPLVELPRLERHSPTEGAKAPDGAIVLFDGSSADEWEKGRVENGLLPNSDVTTKRKFSSYTLHLEFRTPYKPFARGQARGNSGVYQQGRFETQVLDSFGLEGKMNETGGIYSIAGPSVNTCLPPLQWQTYDVDFTAAEFDAAGKIAKNPRITVRLNGTVVHDDVELPKGTPGGPLKDITPDPGPIYLQSHGNPVFYRNIWIVEK